MISPCYNLNSNFPSPSASRPLCVRTIVAGRAGGLTQTATMRTLRKFKDLTGFKINRFTFINREKNGKNAATRWTVKCDCGTTKIVKPQAILSEKIKSCGCLLKEMRANWGLKHGLCRKGKQAPEFWSWTSMKQRCLNPKNEQYHNYGGRGITICDRWINSLQNFVADMGKKPSRNFTLERINVNLGYCPENCKWITKKEQSLNKRTSVKLEIKGVTKNASEWDKEMNLPEGTVCRRLKRGWSSSRAVTTPHKPHKIYE